MPATLQQNALFISSSSIFNFNTSLTSPNLGKIRDEMSIEETALPDPPKWTKTPQQPLPPHTLGKLIVSSSVYEIAGGLETIDRKSLRIENFKFVSSYNWITDPDVSQKLVIPGNPPRMTALTSPITVSPDEGFCPRDICSSLYPEHPMEPAVVAVLQSNPTAFNKVQIVACSKVLNHLLSIARQWKKQGPIRILVERIGNTIYLGRRENQPNDSFELHGFGKSFSSAITAWEPGLEGSKTHQRIVGYKFAGFNMLVRSEVDGYIPVGNDDVEISGSSSRVETVMPNGLKVVVEPGKKQVGQSQLFDLKTRSIPAAGKARDPARDYVSKFWVGQTPTLILAYHTRGLFQPDTFFTRDMDKGVKTWERKRWTDVGRYAAMLQWIYKQVCGERERVEIVQTGEEGQDYVLEVREVMEGVEGVLSEEVKRLLLERKNQNEDSDVEMIL
ncbi:hypothetical protein QBC38DRAFT_476132 [Podospora fimiseda]|uniref:Geranylgeranyl pyrophosphate synthetase n=1 Tax=Podospora fimiseda TaxID=252190 RepID=A0AAN7BRE5_9PEZI|nr:hypothetical protein QBC38DRAFT_476132 [Podospora fimiseda]